MICLVVVTRKVVDDCGTQYHDPPSPPTVHPSHARVFVSCIVCFFLPMCDRARRRPDASFSLGKPVQPHTPVLQPGFQALLLYYSRCTTHDMHDTLLSDILCNLSSIIVALVHAPKIRPANNMARTSKVSDVKMLNRSTVRGRHPSSIIIIIALSSPARWFVRACNAFVPSTVTL